MPTFCIPAKPGDFIDLSFLANTTYYDKNLSNYVLFYDDKVFTPVFCGVTQHDKFMSGFLPTPIPFVNFKSGSLTLGANGELTLFVGDHPNTQHYVSFEGYKSVSDLNAIPLGKPKAPSVEVDLYIAIQDARIHKGTKNTPPTIQFKTNAVTIDKQVTDIDENGDPRYVIDATVTTTLKEVERLGLSEIGKYIVFHDADDIVRVETDVIKPTNKNAVMPLFSYKHTISVHEALPEELVWSEDIKLPIPFSNKKIKIMTVEKSKVIKDGYTVPNLHWSFSSNQWSDVGINLNVEENQLSKFKFSQLAPVRITAYDGAGAKTIVNLTFKDKK